jgi:hypothetical protein
LPLHTRHRVIEAVLIDILGLHNKPKAAVHKLKGPKRRRRRKKKKKKKKKKKSYANLRGFPLIKLNKYDKAGVLF